MEWTPKELVQGVFIAACFALLAHGAKWTLLAGAFALAIFAVLKWAEERDKR